MGRGVGRHTGASSISNSSSGRRPGNIEFKPDVTMSVERFAEEGESERRRPWLAPDNIHTQKYMRVGWRTEG